MPDPPKLLGGPYAMPRCRVGKPLFDTIRGDLVVATITDTPIPWPFGRVSRACRGAPILTGDLERAVRVESNQAIQYYWGVSRWTVERWRRALGVERMNPGTAAVWKELSASKVQSARARRRARSPAARRKMSLRAKAAWARRKAAQTG